MMNMANDVTSWSLVSDVARQLRCSTSTVRRLAVSGQLVRERDSAGAWRYPPESVEAYAATLRAKQPAEQQGDRPEHGRKGELSPGEIAALVGRALEDGHSPREIAIEHALDPIAVGRALEQLGALDQLVLDGPGSGERIDALERVVGDLTDTVASLARRLRQLERGQAVLAVLGRDR